MLWIAGADSLGHALAHVSHHPVIQFFATQLEHVAWEGFRFYDLIFPLFVFMAGVSLVFSLGGRMAEGGRGAALWRLTRRAALLFALGIFYYRGLDGWGNDIRVLGVLQRIALSYLFAGALHLFLKPRGLMVALAVILLGYWALMALVPVPGFGAGRLVPGENLAHWVDEHYLPGRKWSGKYDPEGLLSTLPAIGTCLLGVLAGIALRSTARAPLDTVKRLALVGVALLVTGHVWGLAFPIIKSLWTSSYVCVAGGWSFLLLALFYWLIDVRGWKTWCQPFVWIGMNSITIYLIGNLLDFDRIAARVTGGHVSDWFDAAVTPGFGRLVTALAGMGLCVWLARLMYRHKMFLRV
jgi:predicted acyltransferase